MTDIQVLNRKGILEGLVVGRLSLRLWLSNCNKEIGEILRPAQSLICPRISWRTRTWYQTIHVSLEVIE
jgi:hypothetical protein